MRVPSAPMKSLMEYALLLVSPTLDAVPGSAWAGTPPVGAVPARAGAAGACASMAGSRAADGDDGWVSAVRDAGTDFEPCEAAVVVTVGPPGTSVAMAAADPSAPTRRSLALAGPGAVTRASAPRIT